MGLLMRWGGVRGSTGAIDALRTLFEPAHRHTVEEREHERIARHEDDEGAPPREGPLDLDARRVTIRRRVPPPS